MDILIPLVIVMALVLLNGLFVAAEFAMISVPRTAIEKRAADGQPTADLVRQILHDPLRQDRYIATAQLGITFASLGLGMYGEHTLAGWIAHWLESVDATGLPKWITAHTLASLLAIALLTYLHIVIGEMVPKSIALIHAERTVLWITRPMLLIKAMLYPLVIGFNGLGNAILRQMGVERRLTTGHFHSSEELQFIVEESQEGGMLRGESGRILRELFDFGELTAGEVMVPRVRVIGLPLGAAPEHLKQLLSKAQHTRYPVYEGDLDHIVGVVHIKDLLRLLYEGRPLTRQDVRATAFVPETTELDSVLEAMRQARTHLVVVMDEHGGTAGVVTIDDLCDEAVGDVKEGPGQAPEINRTEDGRLYVAGTVRLDQIGESLDRVLEHEQVDTVSGLVLALLERPPQVGDSVDYEGLHFEVVAVKGHGVQECVVTPLIEPDATPEETAPDQT